jgi:SAM-dependent methyltransferase
LIRNIISRSKAMMSFLEMPLGYLASQWVIGGIKARKRCMQDHIRLSKGMRVLDVGCGPGYVAELLAGSEYVGLDTDKKYIDYARHRYGKCGEFHCTPLTEDFLKKRRSFDYVLMNGVLHHLSDKESSVVLGLCHKALKLGGSMVTLDGFYADDADPITRFLLDRDRGKFIRTKSRYLALVRSVFSWVKSYEHSDYFHVPYNVLVMECRREN